jgi:hypothetical protein
MTKEGGMYDLAGKAVLSYPNELDSRKFSVLGLASIQQFNIGKVQPPAPSKHPEKVRLFTAPRKS